MSSYIGSRGKNLSHTICKEDIPLPESCKYLGIKLDYRRAKLKGNRLTQDGPSIDRIDSSKGYTPDNVQVISCLANRMKQEANREQLIAFARGVLAVHCPSKS